MADESVTATAEAGKVVDAHMDLMKAYDITRFLSKAMVGSTYDEGELEGLGSILEHCGNLMWPAVEALAAFPKEASHA